MAIRYFSFYPGCSLESSAQEYRLSADALANKLNIELIELSDWNCCGATSAHAIAPPEVAIALAARNLKIADEMSMDLVAACAACFNRLKYAKYKLLKDDGLRQNTISKIGADLKLTIDVKHLIEVVYEAIKENNNSIIKKRPLEGFKPACYYGCLLVRPYRIMHFGNPEQPGIIEEVLKLAGAEPVDWYYKVECCGAALSITKLQAIYPMIYKILKNAKENNANCVVVACPFCHSNLDLREAAVEKIYNDKLGLPIFYFTQLLSLAAGVEASRLGLNGHMVSPWRLLRALKFA